MATQATSVADVRAELIKAEQSKADDINKERKGKGTRLRVGQTRGKNPKVINWEAFDTDQPETLPTTADEFMALTDTKDEKVFVSYLVDGYNASQYAAASDVLSEYVEPNWPADLSRQFKTAVNQYVAGTGSAIEDVVSLMKPAFQKAFEAKMAAAKAAQ